MIGLVCLRRVFGRHVRTSVGYDLKQCNYMLDPHAFDALAPLRCLTVLSRPEMETVNAVNY